MRIYLALQQFVDGRVMFRRWSPDCEGVPPGGAYQKQTPEAVAWFNRVLYPDATRPGIDPFEVIEPCNLDPTSSAQ